MVKDSSILHLPSSSSSKIHDAPPPTRRRLRVLVRPEPEEGSYSSSSSEDDDEQDESLQSEWNLFARLSPRVARELAASAAVSEEEEHGRMRNIASSCIEFLPLQIRFLSSGETVYASYNGGEVLVSSSSITPSSSPRRCAEDEAEGDEVIELPACLIPPSSSYSSSREAEGLEVEVSVLTLLTLSSSASSLSTPLTTVCRDADQVRVEPLTLDDWTLLSLHASWLEGGGLLRQVSVVYPNQVVPIVIVSVAGVASSSATCCRNRDVVRFRVLPWGEEEEVELSSSLVEKDIGNSNSNKKRNQLHFGPCCLRLVAETRVIVIPPPESCSSLDNQKLTQDTTILRIYPGLMDYNRAIRELASYLQEKKNSKKEKMDDDDDLVVLVMVDQCCALVHPDAAATFGGGGSYGSSGGVASSSSRDSFLTVIESNSREENSNHENGGDSSGTTSSRNQRSVIVRVKMSPAVPRDGIVLHPLTRLDLQLDLLVDRVVLKPLPLEQEVGIGRIREQVDSRKLRFGLERVDIQRNRIDPSWRFPDCCKSGSAGTVAQGLLDEDLSLEPPVELRNVPLRIGAVFSLPWTQNGLSFDDATRLFRLTVVAGDEPVGSGTSEEYVLSRDVADLVQLKTITPTQYNRIATTSVTVAESSYLARSLLPYSSCWEALLSSSHPRPRLATLVCGEIGSGKTYTSLLIGARAQLLQGRTVVYLDCQRLKSGRGLRLQDIMQELSRVFQCAERSLPSTIILDDLDELLPHIDDGFSSGSRNVQPHNPVMVDQCHAIGGLLGHLLRAISASKCDFEIVYTCREPESLSASVRSAFSTLETVRLPCLSAKDKEGLFHAFLDRLQDLQTWTTARPERRITSAVEFGHTTLCYRPRDLEQLANRVNRSLRAAKAPTFRHCLEEALNEYLPLSKRAASAEQIRHDYTLKDIGGLFNVKRILTATILRPARYHRVYKNAQVRLPRGLLLFGPPGCGKSYVVPALARECGYPLILCRGCEILDKYIGASEMKVRELFSRAASVAPSLLWIDELDALAPRRGSDNTGVTDRIVNQLLTFLDGVEDTSVSGTIYVVASSSRPDKIDPALLRPGRLERHVYVGLPEDEDEFTDLLVKISTNYSVSDELSDFLSSGKFIATLSRQVPGFLELSAADLTSVFSTAQIMAAHEVLEQCSGSPTRDREAVVTADHLLRAFRSTKPSLGSDDRAKLNAIYSWFWNQSSPKKTERFEKLHSNGLRVALK